MQDETEHGAPRKRTRDESDADDQHHGGAAPAACWRTMDRYESRGTGTQLDSDGDTDMTVPSWSRVFAADSDSDSESGSEDDMSRAVQPTQRVLVSSATTTTPKNAERIRGDDHSAVLGIRGPATLVSRKRSYDEWRVAWSEYHDRHRGADAENHGGLVVAPGSPTEFYRRLATLDFSSMFPINIVAFGMHPHGRLFPPDIVAPGQMASRTYTCRDILLALLADTQRALNESMVVVVDLGHIMLYPRGGSAFTDNLKSMIERRRAIVAQIPLTANLSERAALCETERALKKKCNILYGLMGASEEKMKKMKKMGMRVEQHDPGSCAGVAALGRLCISVLRGLVSTDAAAVFGSEVIATFTDSCITIMPPGSDPLTDKETTERIVLRAFRMRLAAHLQGALAESIVDTALADADRSLDDWVLDPLRSDPAMRANAVHVVGMCLLPIDPSLFHIKLENRASYGFFSGRANCYSLHLDDGSWIHKGLRKKGRSPYALNAIRHFIERILSGNPDIKLVDRAASALAVFKTSEMARISVCPEDYLLPFNDANTETEIDKSVQALEDKSCWRIACRWSRGTFRDVGLYSRPWRDPVLLSCSKYAEIVDCYKHISAPGTSRICIDEAAMFDAIYGPDLRTLGFVTSHAIVLRDPTLVHIRTERIGHSFTPAGPVDYIIRGQYTVDVPALWHQLSSVMIVDNKESLDSPIVHRLLDAAASAGNPLTAVALCDSTATHEVHDDDICKMFFDVEQRTDELPVDEVCMRLHVAPGARSLDDVPDRVLWLGMRRLISAVVQTLLNVYNVSDCFRIGGTPLRIMYDDHGVIPMDVPDVYTIASASCRAKMSFHVVFQCHVERRVNKMLAVQLGRNNGFNEVDTGVYGTSLRFPLSGKFTLIDGGGIIAENRQLLVPLAAMSDVSPNGNTNFWSLVHARPTREQFERAILTNLMPGSPGFVHPLAIRMVRTDESSWSSLGTVLTIPDTLPDALNALILLRFGDLIVDPEKRRALRVIAQRSPDGKYFRIRPSELIKCKVCNMRTHTSDYYMLRRHKTISGSIYILRCNRNERGQRVLFWRDDSDTVAGLPVTLSDGSVVDINPSLPVSASDPDPDPDADTDTDTDTDATVNVRPILTFVISQGGAITRDFEAEEKSRLRAAALATDLVLLNAVDKAKVARIKAKKELSHLVVAQILPMFQSTLDEYLAAHRAGVASLVRGYDPEYKIHADLQIGMKAMIRATTGVGKNVCVFDFIEAHRDQITAVVFTSTRHTYTHDMMRRIANAADKLGVGEAVTNLTAERGAISLEKHPLAIIQIESLCRLTDYHRFGRGLLVVADEFSSCAGQLRKKDDRVGDSFASLLRAAGTCFFMDANFTDIGRTFIADVFPAGEIYEARADGSIVPASGGVVSFTDYHMPSSAKCLVHTFADSSPEELGAVADRMKKVLGKHRTFAAPCSDQGIARSLALHINSWLRETNTPGSVLFINGINAEVAMHDQISVDGEVFGPNTLSQYALKFKSFADIQTFIVENNIVAFFYTSTLSCGVSLTFDYFDVLIPVLSSITESLTAGQMVRRIRALRMNRVYLYLSIGSLLSLIFHANHDAKDPLDYALASGLYSEFIRLSGLCSDDYGRFDSDDLARIRRSILVNMHHDHLAAEWLRLFFRCLLTSGWSLTFLPRTDSISLVTEIRPAKFPLADVLNAEPSLDIFPQVIARCDAVAVGVFDCAAIHNFLMDIKSPYMRAALEKAFILRAIGIDYAVKENWDVVGAPLVALYSIKRAKPLVKRFAILFSDALKHQVFTPVNRAILFTSLLAYSLNYSPAKLNAIYKSSASSILPLPPKILAGGAAAASGCRTFGPVAPSGRSSAPAVVAYDDVALFDPDAPPDEDDDAILDTDTTVASALATDAAGPVVSAMACADVIDKSVNLRAIGPEMREMLAVLALHNGDVLAQRSDSLGREAIHFRGGPFGSATDTILELRCIHIAHGIYGRIVKLATENTPIHISRICGASTELVQIVAAINENSKVLEMADASDSAPKMSAEIKKVYDCAVKELAKLEGELADVDELLVANIAERDMMCAPGMVKGTNISRTINRAMGRAVKLLTDIATCKRHIEHIETKPAAKRIRDRISRFVDCYWLFFDSAPRVSWLPITVAGENDCFSITLS